jgi:hypothetical protein
MKRRSGGGWADIQNVYRRSGGGWVLVWRAYTPFTASASGSSTSFNLGNKTTPTTRVMSTLATASASGGNNSFSYSWRVIGSGGGASGASVSGNGTQCSVQCTAQLNGGNYVDVACDISDGTSAQTVTARCSFNYFNTV